MVSILCPQCSAEILNEPSSCPECGCVGLSETYYELLLDRDGHAAEAEVLAALQQSGIFRFCYAHKSRVKPELKLLEKTERKRKEKPNYKLQDITDVIGIRFVTLLRKEMPQVFEAMIDIINHVSPLNPNPFLKGRLDEIIVYHTNPNDLILVELKKIAKKKKIKKKMVGKVSKESYSSIHLVTRLNKKINKLSDGSKDYYIPVEVQIRTVFEDAWGEIDHKYGYVIRTGKEQGKPVSNAQSVLRHLKIMKQFSDACAEYADVIHLEATTKEDEVVDTARVVSVGADEDIIESFRTLRVNPKHVNSYIEARKLRVKAQKDENEQRGKGQEEALQAAEKFREIAKFYNDEDITHDNRKEFLFYYYVKMNEALCLLIANQPEAVKIAKSIYELLDIKYHSFPLLRMRLAQVYGKIGLLDEAISTFEEATVMLAEFEKKGCKYSDELPVADYLHMKVYLPKLYGYYIWTKAEGLDAKRLKDKLSLLGFAYNLTYQAMQHDLHNLALRNNLLYFSVEIKRLSHGTEFAAKYAEFGDAIKDHLQAVEEACPLDSCRDIDTLDTFVKAYDLMGDKDKALKILSRLDPLTESALAMSPCDRDVLIKMQKEAAELRLKYAP